MVAACCGLSPREFASGTSVRKKTRLSKAGNAWLRTALNVPTLTAIRCNHPLRAFLAWLVAAGKPRMRAMGNRGQRGNASGEQPPTGGLSALVPIPNDRRRPRAAPFGVGPWAGAPIGSQRCPIFRTG